MKSHIITFVLTLSFLAPFAVAGDTVTEKEIKVFGNCGQCKTRIEKAMKIPEVKFAKWDKKSKMLKIAYLSEKITLDSLQQRLAAVGHDTQTFKAADSVYSELPGCCLYRDGDHTH